MGIRRNRTNRRKPGTGKRTILSLVIVIIILCGAIFLLEWLKATSGHKANPNLEERHKIPERQSYTQSEFQPYTSNHLPDLKSIRKRKSVSSGTVAIVIDDMGSSLKEANSLISIDVPLTFSLIPGLSKVSEVANIARERGYQVIIHIPMEPKGYPKQRLEDNGLLLSHTDEEIAQRVDGYLKQVPYAAGANNHMGSKFTEDEQKMKIVLNQLKAKGLFYLDSRTTPKSVGLSLARSMEINSAGRNVFLDNTKDMASITAQLDQLASLARKKGSAIGICHPHRKTIEALSINLPRLQKEGITFVSVGDLVR